MDDGLNHPADQLALVRQRIKALQEQEEELKEACKKLAPEDRVGRYNEVRVTEVERTTMDTKGLKALLGEDALKPYMKTAKSMTVTIKSLEA